MRYLIFIFLLFSLGATAREIEKKKFTCNFKLDVVSPKNASPYLVQAFNKAFGGKNTIVIDQENIDSFGGYLQNLNNAKDMDIILVKKHFPLRFSFEFVGVSLAGMIKGKAKNCIRH